MKINQGQGAKSKLEKSTVVDKDSGNSVKSEVRTSSGMFLDKRQKMVKTFKYCGMRRSPVRNCSHGWKSQPKDETFSECAKNGLAVKPVKGDALMFYNLKPDAVPDPLSLHASCPVMNGKKWVAKKWMRLGSFYTIPSAPSAVEIETEIEPESVVACDELVEKEEL
ncbi:prolyl 4-hydroxylase 4 precursor [Carex littledalei]|uniref:Prolyl 4-hydroxylase 4 n=1 Tax=Carex littledalei TaxID=544730 RepID=A0A833QPJ6_9POAL|nr:prolyl 4-hydroxylase 4 precursor [Carex littledalei]